MYFYIFCFSHDFLFFALMWFFNSFSNKPLYCLYASNSFSLVLANCIDKFRACKQVSSDLSSVNFSISRLNFLTMTLCSSLNSSIVLIIPGKFLLMAGTYDELLLSFSLLILKNIKIKHKKIDTILFIL